MRNRNHRVVVCFSDAEINRLNQAVELSGMSREAYVRTFLDGKTPIAIPPKDYFRLAKEMRAAGNTLNRIAAQMFSTKMFDAAAYQRTAKKVLKVADEMHMVLVPRKDN